MVENKKVLDIGCGHGDFTIRCSPRVKEIVGLDITSDFIQTGKDNNFNNVTFIVSNTQNKLPFNEFDYVYNRKGPTSAYIDLKRIVKNGGHIISLHPGDQISPELPQFFPNLFESPLEGTPRLDKIKRNLKKGMLLEQTKIETVTDGKRLHHDMMPVCYAISCFCSLKKRAVFHIYWVE